MRDYVKIPIEIWRQFHDAHKGFDPIYRPNYSLDLSIQDIRKLLAEAEADDRVELRLTKPQLAALWYIIRSSLDGSLWVDKLDPYRKNAHDSARYDLVCDTCHQVVGIVRRGYADAGKPKICEDKPLPVLRVLRQTSSLIPDTIVPQISNAYGNLGAVDVGNLTIPADDVIALAKALEQNA